MTRTWRWRPLIGVPQHTSNNAPHPAVVVGSGPGGATVTRELASHGWKLLILERGQRKPVTGTMWA